MSRDLKGDSVAQAAATVIVVGPVDSGDMLDGTTAAVVDKQRGFSCPVAASREPQAGGNHTDAPPTRAELLAPGSQQVGYRAQRKATFPKTLEIPHNFEF